jgi:hypothetical protein
MTKTFCDRCGVYAMESVTPFVKVQLRYNDDATKTWDLCATCRKAVDSALADAMAGTQKPKPADPKVQATPDVKTAPRPS